MEILAWSIGVPSSGVDYQERVHSFSLHRDCCLGDPYLRCIALLGGWALERSGVCYGRRLRCEASSSGAKYAARYGRANLLAMISVVLFLRMQLGARS